jgi:2-polyprenyl-3-methyl-5-hydroxy-6-metoxy-1,4-benzoquinol methylase
MKKEPFWERASRDGGKDPFGPASPEVLDLLPLLHPGSSVLDMGCGAGRNALPLAQAGMVVTALDLGSASK